MWGPGAPSASPALPGLLIQPQNGAKGTTGVGPQRQPKRDQLEAKAYQLAQSIGEIRKLVTGNGPLPPAKVGKAEPSEEPANGQLTKKNCMEASVALGLLGNLIGEDAVALAKARINQKAKAKDPASRIQAAQHRVKDIGIKIDRADAGIANMEQRIAAIAKEIEAQKGQRVALIKEREAALTEQREALDAQKEQVQVLLSEEEPPEMAEAVKWVDEQLSKGNLDPKGL